MQISNRFSIGRLSRIIIAISDFHRIIHELFLFADVYSCV